MADYPIILSQSHITEDNIYTATSNPTLVSKIYDQDKDTKWYSAGEDTDGDAAGFSDIILKSNVDLVNRTFDTLILLNTNFKTFTAYYWDGAAWQSWITESNNQLTNYIKKASQVTSAKFRIECTHTQSANQEKEVGELIVANEQYVFTSYLSSYEPVIRPREDNVRKSDFSLSSWHIKDKYFARWTLEFVSKTVRDLIFNVYKVHNPVIWIPEPDSVPEDVYFVKWVADFIKNYSRIPKVVGYDIVSELEEV